MPKTDNDKVIALAALLQSCSLVREIAYNGQCNFNQLATCTNSILKVDAPNSEAIYEGLNNLQTGFRLVSAELASPNDREMTRYMISLLSLERKLRKRDDMMRYIGAGIKDAQARLEYFPPMHENIIAILADVYTSTISTLSPRIMVSGEQIHLSHAENANRIRALLLSGVRAAMLWRQSGGNWFNLLLKRKSYAAQAQQILEQMESDPAATDA